MHSLAPSIKVVWRAKTALFWIIALAVATVFDVTGIAKPDRMIPFGVLGGTTLVLGTLSTIYIPMLRYRFWKYELRPEELALTRGIWNRVHTIVPLRRIQHLDVSQDVIERNYELGKLIVHTAGTQSSSVVVPGLEFEEAERLRYEIKNHINEYAV